MKILVIDIGSNSVRLMKMADGKTLYKKVCTTRLGRGLAQTGMLQSDAIERTVQAICNFYSIAKAENPDLIFAFATAAVRSASNGHVLIDAVKTECGLTIDVVSGEVEAEIGLLGAVGYNDGGIIDIGGASTEVSIRRNGQRCYSHSANIGAVKLWDLAGRDILKADSVVKEYCKTYGDISQYGKNIYAIGGTATTLASVTLGLEIYNPDIVQGTVLSLQKVEQLVQTLMSLPVEEVKKIKGMDKDRADIIGGGGVILINVMRLLGIEQVTVSERDNLEGYVLYRLRGEKL